MLSSSEAVHVLLNKQRGHFVILFQSDPDVGSALYFCSLQMYSDKQWYGWNNGACANNMVSEPRLTQRMHFALSCYGT